LTPGLGVARLHRFEGFEQLLEGGSMDTKSPLEMGRGEVLSYFRIHHQDERLIDVVLIFLLIGTIGKRFSLSWLS
jgi:hypothetical protein